MSEEPKGPFDMFELSVALLLGVCAIGAALAGQQGGQWGGRQLERFSEANTLTTKASKEYNEAVSNINSDYAAVAQAKRSILDAIYARSADQKERDLQTASYFLTQQISEDAYNALGLPADKLDKDEPGQKKAATEADIEADLKDVIPEDELIAALDTELHDDDAYFDNMFKNAEKLFKEADVKFAEGRQANDNGDGFDLAQVFFAVALFFGGIALVFKTQLRWGFFGVGFVTFLYAAFYMARLPWA